MVSAQSLPKLAIARVTSSSSVSKQFEIPAAADAGTAPEQPADLTGVWNGETHTGKKAFPFVLTITKAADGSQYAELKNIKRGNDFHSTLVSCSGDHVTIKFSEGSKSQFLDGKLDPGNTQMQMNWNNGEGDSRMVLERAQTMSNGKQTGGTVAPVVTLDAISHALETQLTDQFNAEHTFDIMEPDDLASAIPRAENQTYNLYDIAVARQFTGAGIHYLLVTSIEDLKNETVDRAQGRVAYETANGSAASVRASSRQETAQAAAHSAVATQGKFEAHRVIDQNIYLVVRSRLFDAATGGLLDSSSQTFTTNRTYIALADGAKEVSASDLFEAAAKNLAERIAMREREAIFPIAVLTKDDKEITINCGADAGLKTGQLLDVYAVGKELKDPNTGESLGNDEQLVGRVTVSETQPKFCKAKVWEDDGITIGNLVRRDKAN